MYSKETLEVLEDFDDFLDDESDEKDTLVDRLEEQDSQLPTLILLSLVGTPSELPKLSLERRRCPASRSKY